MTDNEIIKALKICNSLHLRCGNGCPYYEVPYKNGQRCSEMMIDDALDLINRQKAEIERLERRGIFPEKGFFNLLCGALVFTKTLEEYNEFRKTIKSEAIKEFAEKLKDELQKVIWSCNVDLRAELNKTYVTNKVWSCINSLAKELTESKNDFEG